jgi:hypothetical protein
MWRFAFGVSWSLTVGYTQKKRPTGIQRGREVPPLFPDEAGAVTMRVGGLVVDRAEHPDVGESAGPTPPADNGRGPRVRRSRGVVPYRGGWTETSTPLTQPRREPM